MFAVHPVDGSFSDQWILFLKNNNINYHVVNIFDGDIINTLKSLNVKYLLVHPQMADPVGRMVVGNIIAATIGSGIRVFPNFNDFWHFDDKIAQKYIFESREIDSPKTYVFYSARSAREWIESAEFPLVFKLKSGAGSVNVELIKTKKQALQRINKMFGSGYPSSDGAVKDLATKLRKHNANKDYVAVLRRLPNTIKNFIKYRKNIQNEKGYVLFQEFIEKNECDIRVTVIGGRAFCFRRMVRPGDFRASGSGFIDYSKDNIDKKFINKAFEVSDKINSKCIALDFIERKGTGDALVVEMSFGFMSDAVYACPGHWLKNGEWVEGNVWPQVAILEDLINDR